MESDKDTIGEGATHEHQCGRRRKGRGVATPDEVALAQECRRKAGNPATLQDLHTDALQPRTKECYAGVENEWASFCGSSFDSDLTVTRVKAEAFTLYLTQRQKKNSKDENAKLDSASIRSYLSGISALQLKQNPEVPRDDIAWSARVGTIIDDHEKLSESKKRSDPNVDQTLRCIVTRNI